MLFIRVLERRPAGAFDNANRGAERYAAARSDTTMNQPQHTRGNLGLVQEEKC